jgi:hypothetical protein
MTISDQDLRRALTERAEAVDRGPVRAAHDIGALARLVATSPNSGRRVSRLGGWFVGRPVAIGSLVIAIALVLSITVGPLAPPRDSRSAEPGASPSLQPSPTSSGAAASKSSPPSMSITGCETLSFSPSRCAAVIARARASAQPTIAADEVVSAEVAPPPAPDVGSLGSFPLAEVRLALVDGGTAKVVVRCGLPGPSDRACNPDARIYIFGGVDHDVPCGTEEGGPDNPCATLPPTARPGSVAAAQPLRVAAFDIPLGRTGRYEVLVGEAGLPDGVLNERSARLVDDTPTTFWIDDGVHIDVRPDEPSRPPIGSIYREPYDGVEPVHVWLVFDVVEVAPGAVLQVRDLVIR